MARHESDREDLLREATALVERIELAPLAQTDGDGSIGDFTRAEQRIVVGFRVSGAVSFFFGSDPVYQFNAAGELRRAYAGGRLFKAVGGRLVSLDRARQQDEVQLISRDLTPDAQAAFVTAMRKRLTELRAAIDRADMLVTGQVPEGADVLSRVRQWLATHDEVPIAKSPRA